MDLFQHESWRRQGRLDEYRAKQVLAAAGIPVVREAHAGNASELVAAADRIGYPVVVKGLGAALGHKSELGIVHVGVPDGAAVAAAVRRIEAQAGEGLEGYLVQEMRPGRRELAAGMFRDPDFGPVVMFGVGGIAAEAMSDVTFRLAPLTAGDAAEMVSEIRADALLGPFRGEAAVDREQIVSILLALSDLACTHSDLGEIDINPLIVDSAGGLCAVDALMVRQAPAERDPRPAVAPAALHRFFHPRSIAFVGASATFGKWGYILPTLTRAGGYAGGIRLVNPKGGEMLGRPVYPTITDVPEPVDLAVVTVPAARVPDLIPRLTEKGCRNMLLITSGFGETGPEGKERERALMAQARAAGILVLGPNTMGINNPHIDLYCTGSRVWPAPGDTAVVCQSGNMGVQLLVFAEAQGIGIRCFAGSGNEGMIAIEDYLEGFGADDRTRNIMLYVESLKESRRFFETARRVSPRKPIVLMKGGRTRGGSRAAATHTGALATDMKVFRAMCRQAGIVMVDYPMELLDCAAAFSSLPLPRGKRVAVVTMGGGWGVVTADLCEEFGLCLPDLSPDLVAELDRILPPYWSRANPVDIVGEQGAEVAFAALEALMAWQGCDAVINLGILGRKPFVGQLVDAATAGDPTFSPELAGRINGAIGQFEERYINRMAELMARHDKPVIAVTFMPDETGEKTVVTVADSPHSVVQYATPERAVKTLSKMVQYDAFRKRGTADPAGSGR